MRDYGRVYCQFWASATISGLSDDARLLALYLLTCSHGTLAGVFRIPDGYVSEDIGWKSGRVSEAFRELFLTNFAYRCETTKWVWIRKFMEWNPPENPNQWKAATKIAKSIPKECGWIIDFIEVFGEKLGLTMDMYSNRSRTVQEPFLNQEQEQEQEQETKETPLPPSGSEKPKRTRKPRSEQDISPENQYQFDKVWEAWARTHPRTGEPVHKGSKAMAERAFQRIVSSGECTAREAKVCGMLYAKAEQYNPAIQAKVYDAWDYRDHAYMHVATFYGPEKRPYRQLLPIAREVITEADSRAAMGVAS